MHEGLINSKPSTRKSHRGIASFCSHPFDVTVFLGCTSHGERDPAVTSDVVQNVRLVTARPQHRRLAPTHARGLPGKSHPLRDLVQGKREPATAHDVKHHVDMGQRQARTLDL